MRFDYLVHNGGWITLLIYNHNGIVLEKIVVEDQEMVERFHQEVVPYDGTLYKQWALRNYIRPLNKGVIR